MNQATISRRLLGLREKSATTQDDLSRALGFKDRQTLSTIEMGKRPITPAELVKAASFFGVPVDYFTDPFELAGEGKFSWREKNGDAGGLQQFQERAGRWIATYRHLGRLRGATVNSALIRVDLTTKSSFEAAAEQGEAVGRALGLGDTPALDLVAALERQLDTLVLLVDTLDGISGAACQLGPLNIVIVNRNEPASRRAFDLAHELFHLVTWQQMPPPHLDMGERINSRSGRRVEQLADNFAAGLLMPRPLVETFVSSHPVPKTENDLPQWLRMGANRFQVSAQAFKWRVVDLKILSRAKAERVDADSLRMADSSSKPAQFSSKFIEMIGWGIDQGALSVRKAANILDLSIDELSRIFQAHGIQAPFEL